MTVLTAHKSSKSNGYTIVEMILVIVVIGILAAMTIGGYSQWRKTVAKREVQSDLQGVGAAMESARNFNDVYPTTGIPSTFSPSPDVTLTYKAAVSSTTVYCFEAVSVKVPTVIYHLDSTNGNKTPQVGIC